MRLLKSFSRTTASIHFSVGRLVEARARLEERQQQRLEASRDVVDDGRTELHNVSLTRSSSRTQMLY